MGLLVMGGGEGGLNADIQVILSLDHGLAMPHGEDRWYHLINRQHAPLQTLPPPPNTKLWIITP